ncbi:RagB/SusD family nutrient uptake outer membrane protein [Aquimarina sp. U1-2]|uniref:RagB/SusD family nutrient uptake outer membrane protein n=1 Tax=Aquimarina sp. U1-2 TaxID=2823141 RepID=UPI001AECC250|nr:RagB/SusD family nutrient uptake outer membrane protein [Aquimarina sp. U1-2]MBP2833547.1 RagB/SusD family nutrient uptake outer membrane protein [Aquimarina sp. U1-2]
MNTIIKNITVIFALVFALSCEDTLESTIPAGVEISDTVTDLESLEIATNGIYTRLIDGDVYRRGLIVIASLLSDEASIDPFDNRGRFVEYDTYTVVANDARATNLWNDLYRAVSQSSIVINLSSQVEFPEGDIEEANHFIGEAYALRALSYLQLQKMFSQPYNFTTEASHLGAILPNFDLVGFEIQFPPRATTNEVYQRIVEDLETAIRLMDDRNGNLRFTKNAVRALLSRVMLHMENWRASEILATEVINSSGISLEEPSEYLEQWNLGASPESLLSLVTVPEDIPGEASLGFFFLGDDEAFVTQNLIDTFTDSDIRKSLYPFNEDLGQFRMAKFPNVAGTDNIPVIRISEVYLLKAESHARLGEDTQAQDALNEVIQARDENAAPITDTGNTLINRILLERRKELAFEGLRLFDLTRTMSTFTKFRINEDDIIVDAPFNFTILPIPLDEINRNTAIRELNQQNPGY